MKQIVQGDILFIETGFVLAEYDKLPSKVIALGEKTGHAHVLEGPGDLYGYGNRPSRLHAFGDVKIRHDEHGDVDLPAGQYQIVRQKTFDYEADFKKQKAEKPVVD